MTKARARERAKAKAAAARTGKKPDSGADRPEEKTRPGKFDSGRFDSGPGSISRPSAGATARIVTRGAARSR